MQPFDQMAAGYSHPLSHTHGVLVRQPSTQRAQVQVLLSVLGSLLKLNVPR